MELKLHVYVSVVSKIEDADMILLLNDYNNFTKNQTYEIFEDRYENQYLLNDDYEESIEPLKDCNRNILLSIKGKIL